MEAVAFGVFADMMNETADAIFKPMPSPSRLGSDLLAIAPAPAPSHRNAGEQQANEDDDRGDLKPDKAAEFAQDHLGPIAPRRGQRVADGLDAVGQSPQPPFEQIGPIIKRRDDQSPGQDNGA